MTFYIRPRQDFSLARMAQAMRCLICCAKCLKDHNLGSVKE